MKTWVDTLHVSNYINMSTTFAWSTVYSSLSNAQISSPRAMNHPFFTFTTFTVIIGSNSWLAPVFNCSWLSATGTDVLIDTKDTFSCWLHSLWWCMLQNFEATIHPTLQDIPNGACIVGFTPWTEPLPILDIAKKSSVRKYYSLWQNIIIKVFYGIYQSNFSCPSFNHFKSMAIRGNIRQLWTYMYVCVVKILFRYITFFDAHCQG